MGGFTITSNSSSKFQFRSNSSSAKKVSNSNSPQRFLASASPPDGSVPDPNNRGNVLVCYEVSPGVFESLSIPAVDLPNYNFGATDSDGLCPTDPTASCPPGSSRDCAGNCVPVGTIPTFVRDCNDNCYDRTAGPPPFLLDCSGVCYDATTNPPNVPDCFGVCGGAAIRDCAGVCDGDAVYDCFGTCDGGAFEDCGGNCINCTIPPVTSGTQGQLKKVDPKVLAKNHQKNTKLRSRSGARKASKVTTQKSGSKTTKAVKVSNMSPAYLAMRRKAIFK